MDQDDQIDEVEETPAYDKLMASLSGVTTGKHAALFKKRKLEVSTP